MEIEFNRQLHLKVWVGEELRVIVKSDYPELTLDYLTKDSQKNYVCYKLTKNDTFFYNTHPNLSRQEEYSSELIKLAGDIIP